MKVTYSEVEKLNKRHRRKLKRHYQGFTTVCSSSQSCGGSKRMHTFVVSVFEKIDYTHISKDAELRIVLEYRDNVFIQAQKADLFS